MPMYSSPYSASLPDPWGAYHCRLDRTRGLLFGPQPGWSGLDYYKAHAPNLDPALYHRVLKGQCGTKGVEPHVAKDWHKQIYESLGDIRTYLPYLGHAAAYEAFLIWNRNRSEVGLGSDCGQQREAVIAIAIAEVCRVFQIAQAHHEQRKLWEACEAAAATASIINSQELGDDGRSGGNHISPSPPSWSNSPSRDESPDDRSVSHGSRSHSRRSSSASNSHPAITSPVNGSPSHPASSIPTQANSHNGESPLNHYSGSSPHYTTVTYSQQYPVGVQGVPIVGSAYAPNRVLLNAGFYQPAQILVVQPCYILGPSIIIQQPARRSSRRATSRRGDSHSASK